MQETPAKPVASAPDRTATPPGGWGPVAAGAAIVLAALAAYHNCFDAPFLFDDIPAIVDNQTIRHLWPPGEALSPPADGAGVTGRPLVNLSLAVNYALEGLNVRGYHAMNLALHVLAALTLWGVLRRTLVLSCRSLLAGDGIKRPAPESPASRLLQQNAESIAFGAALLWTVHPLLTESVVCVVQRNEVMGGLFYLLTLYCFIRGVEVGRVSDPPLRPVKDRSYLTWLGLAVLSCLLGMASKEIVATAPLLVLLYDRTFVAGTFRAAWQRRKLFFAALAATWLLLAWLMVHTGQREGTVGFGLGVGSWEYLLTQCRALVLYLKLSFWPHPLVVDYGMTVVKSLGEVWWQGLLVMGLLTATVIALRRKPVAGFVGAWFFVILAPSSSFVPLVTQTAAEHRMYLPLIAVIVLAMAGLHHLIGRHAAAVGLVAVVGLALVTVRRNEDYRNELGFWTDAIARQPGVARLQVNLGNYYDRTGQWPEAIAHFEQALRLDPRSADAHDNLGKMYVKRRQWAEAIAHFELTKQVLPGDAVVRRSFGTALLNVGLVPEAIAQFELSLQLRPDEADTHNSLGNALMTAGRPAEGIAHYEQALRLKTDFPEAERNLGLALVTTGRTVDALPHFQRAVQLKPDYGEAELYLAIALASLGRFSEAVPHFEKALALDPGSADAHLSYSRALRQLGRMDEAGQHQREALRLNPGLAPGK